MISSLLKPASKWTRLPPFVPFRSLCSSSGPTFGGDSQTNDDLKADRMAKDLRTHEVLSKLRSGVLFIKTSLTWKDMVIDSGSGIGTAFLLEKNKAATAAHVVSEQYIFEIDGKRRKEFLTFRVWAKLPGGVFFEVQVSSIDTVHDVAILTLPEGMVGPHHFIPKLSVVESPLLGQRLYFIGNPGFSLCLKTGIFSTIRTIEDIILNEGVSALHDPARSKLDDCLFEMEGVAASGQSGAGLSSEEGDVIAVIIAGFDNVSNSDPGAMCAMASPIKWVIELLGWERAQSTTEGDVYKNGRIVDSSRVEDVGEEVEDVGEEMEGWEEEEGWETKRGR